MSYSFNGTTAYMERATDIPLTGLPATPLSMIAWVKITDTATYRVPCSIWSAGAAANYYAIWIQDTEVVSALTITSGGAGFATATSSAAVTTGAWCMVHACFGSTADREAGVSAANYGTNTTTIAPAFAANRLTLGYKDNVGNDQFAGLLGLVALYNVKLDHTQLTELLSVAPDAASSYSSCVAYYDLRVNEGTTTMPDTKASYDLTITAATYSSDNPVIAAAGGVRSKRMLLGVG